MRKILKYKLVNGTVPDFIENGGYFPDDAGFMIGVSKEFDERYTPEGTIWLKQAELQAMLDAIPLNLDMPTATLEQFVATFNPFEYCAMTETEWKGMVEDTLATIIEETL